MTRNFFKRHWNGIKYAGIRKHTRWEISAFFWDASEVAYRAGTWVGERLEDLGEWVGRTNK